MSAIVNAEDARFAVFEKVIGILNDMSLKQSFMDEAIVWENENIIPNVNGEFKLFGTSFCFSYNYSKDVSFTYSISITLGEVRIGVVIPSNLHESIQSYAETLIQPYQHPDPVRIVKKIYRSESLLIDYIFRERIGSMESTRQILLTESKEDRIVDMFADSIAKEMLHINNSIMNMLRSVGVIITIDDVINQDNVEYINFQTRLSVTEVCEYLEISYAQVYLRTDKKFTILVSSEDDKKLSEIKLKCMALEKEFSEAVLSI